MKRLPDFSDKELKKKDKRKKEMTMKICNNTDVRVERDNGTGHSKLTVSNASKVGKSLETSAQSRNIK